MIFIELDNGVCASKLKTSIGKAAFNYVCGECDYCLELFHDRGNSNLEKYLSEKKEREILQRFKESFHTQVFVF